jgi:hypothetical protein
MHQETPLQHASTQVLAIPIIPQQQLDHVLLYHAISSEGKPS